MAAHPSRSRSRFDLVFMNLMKHLLWLLLLASCVSQPPQSSKSLERYEFQQPQMGLPFRIVLYAASQEAAEAAATAAFKKIEQLNNVFSDYEFDSELSVLSRSAGEGRDLKVSDELWFVLERAQELASESHGAFDITVGPYTALWRKARREHKLPSAEKLAELAPSVGYEKLVLNPKTHTARLVAPGMRLDLGGIAKGYAIDEALKVLRTKGITRALVMGGGDMSVGEPPPGRKGWRIEIPALDVTNAPPSKFVLLRNRALATSGDLFQHLEINGQRYSHIVDPRTGIGLIDHSLVNVIADDCITADSLTKVASVLDSTSGLALLHRKPGVAVRIMRQPNGRIETIETETFERFQESPGKAAVRLGK